MRGTGLGSEAWGGRGGGDEPFVRMGEKPKEKNNRGDGDFRGRGWKLRAREGSSGESGLSVKKGEPVPPNAKGAPQPLRGKFRDGKKGKKVPGVPGIISAHLLRNQQL